VKQYGVFSLSSRQILGPFEKEEEALSWADKHELLGCFLVMPIKAPEPEIVIDNIVQFKRAAS